MRRVERDPHVLTTLSAVQHRPKLVRKGGAPLGMGAAEPAKWRSHLRGLAGFPPWQVQPVHGGADGVAAAQAAEPRLLGRADLCAAPGLDGRAKGGRPPARWWASAPGPCP